MSTLLMYYERVEIESFAHTSYEHSPRKQHMTRRQVCKSFFILPTLNSLKTNLLQPHLSNFKPIPIWARFSKIINILNSSFPYRFTRPSKRRPRRPQNDIFLGNPTIFNNIRLMNSLGDSIVPNMYKFITNSEQFTTFWTYSHARMSLLDATKMF